MPEHDSFRTFPFDPSSRVDDFDVPDELPGWLAGGSHPAEAYLAGPYDIVSAIYQVLDEHPDLIGMQQAECNAWLPLECECGAIPIEVADPAGPEEMHVLVAVRPCEQLAGHAESLLWADPDHGAAGVHVLAVHVSDRNVAEVGERALHGAPVRLSRISFTGPPPTLVASDLI